MTTAYAKYIGRVGALAVALGVSGAVATTPGVAWADESSSSASSSSTASESNPTSSSSVSASDPSSTSTSPGSSPSSIGPTSTTSSEPATDESGVGADAPVASASSSETVSTDGPAVIVRSSGGAHTSGTDDAPAAVDNRLVDGSQEDAAVAEVEQPAAPAAVDNELVDGSQVDAAVAEVEQPAAADEVTPQAPPKTPDTAPSMAPTPTGAPLENGLNAEPFAQRLTAGIPEASTSTSASSRQSQSSGETEAARLFTAAEIDGLAPDTADQRIATTFTTLQTPEETAPDPISELTACACRLINQVLSVAVTMGTTLGTALAPILTPTEPENPTDNPIMWAVLGWVRRQSEQILASPPVAEAVRTVTTLTYQIYQEITSCGQPATGLPAELERTTIVSGLNEPTDFRFLPDPDGRIIIIEKAGAIKIYPNSDQNFDPITLVVLPTQTANEKGLTGIELDPDYATNGYIYVAYTAADNHDRLSRLTVVDDAIDLDSEVVLMRSDQAAGLIHHGGELHFGPDGMLYWATGDNSNNLNAQDLSNIHGKILRLDPDLYSELDPDATAPAAGHPAGANPFVDDPNAIPQIWAYGLRNPFRFTFTPDGQLLAGDVGNASWEELNIVTRGGNYGWPAAEGVCEGAGCAEYVNPVYTYPHTPDTASAGSITSVLVYTGETFPDSYQNKVFIADFTLGWIKELTFDSGFSNVISERTLDSQAGTTVKLVQGPDGNIYQLTIYPGELSRIAPSGGNRAPTAVLTATPSNGLAPLVVDFSSQGSSDPDPFTTLTYAWDFGDGTTSTLANPSRTYTANGTYDVTLTVSDGEEFDVATTMITVGSTAPSVGEITVSNALYSAGDTVSFTATAVDAEDGTLPPDAYKWTVVFHHADHVHPFQDNIVGPSGSVVIPRDPHNVDTTFYRITLTVTDSSGLSTSQSVDVKPRLVTLTVNASDPEASFTIDGIRHTGSYSEQAVVGVERLLGAPSPQDVANGQLVFNNWSDGGAQSHTIVTPDANATYTVTYDFVAAPESVNL
jgi:glucose/arabinose dehydrogenase